MSRPPKRLTAIEAAQYFQNLDLDDSGDEDELHDNETESDCSYETDSDDYDTLCRLPYGDVV